MTTRKSLRLIAALLCTSLHYASRAGAAGVERSPASEAEFFGMAPRIAEASAAWLSDWKSRKSREAAQAAAVPTLNELEQTELFKRAVALLGTFEVKSGDKVDRLWSLYYQGALVRVDGLHAITLADGRALNRSGMHFSNIVYLTPWGLQRGATYHFHNRHILELSPLDDAYLQALDRSREIAADSIKAAVKKTIEKFGKKR